MFRNFQPTQFEQPNKFKAQNTKGKISGEKGRNEKEGWNLQFGRQNHIFYSYKTSLTAVVQATYFCAFDKTEI